MSTNTAVERKTYEKECSACGEIIQYAHKHKPTTCPQCTAWYWDKPVDERRLFLLQDEYFEKDRDQEVLGRIYLALIDYSRNIIKNKMRNRKILSRDDLEERSIEMANKVIEKYLKNDGGYIKHSFGGILRKIALGVLFGGRKEEDYDSLNARIYDNQKELEENPELFNFQVIGNGSYAEYNDVEQTVLNRENELTEELYSIIDKINTRIKDSETANESLLFLVGVRNKLHRKNTRFMEKFFRLAGNQTKVNIQKTELVIHNYLKDVGSYA